MFATSRTPRPSFDPAPHRSALVPALRAIEGLVAERVRQGERAPLPPELLHGVLRKHPRAGRGLFSRSELIAGFRRFADEAGVRLSEASFAQWVRMRPVRTQSGVAPVTVFTKPFPCPGRCVFCPSDVRMPKSYLSAEPGCQRAEQNGFDPYRQTAQRVRALCAIGHSADKVEIIVLGGTWSFYPEAYQRWFVMRCLDALNDGGAELDADNGFGARDAVQPAAPARGSEAAGRYNAIVKRALSNEHGPALLSRDERAGWNELERAQRRNERAACRNVGFVVETRPDLVDEAEVLRLRRLGCTKLQLGIQSVSDEILARNQRGHDVAATRRAIRLLRAAGFKIHGHMMANLLGATPASDLAEYRQLFDDPDFRPDELKVYPCSLIETAELMRHYRAGEFRPYSFDELAAVLEGVLEATPRYCRLSRVIRDISSGDIVAGNRLSNFREIAERRLAARGRGPADIRSREIRQDAFDAESLRLVCTTYATSVGEERFLELCTGEDRLLGFLRLSLPRSASFVDELGRAAVIRELHVYGAALSLGARASDQAQHRGFGRRLLEEAMRLARAAGHARLSVISAVGTREYYRRHGFADGELYQHLAL